MHKTFSKTFVIFYIALGVIIFTQMPTKAIATPFRHHEINQKVTKYNSLFDITKFKALIPNTYRELDVNLINGNSTSDEAFVLDKPYFMVKEFGYESIILFKKNGE